ncbi:YbhN family protein [Streptomyces sp. HUAS ZL42]|uniref:lysylphosphatidylglycerol synthase transmembrane domain-containing protein n=1 Tax=Streptomyces sp. HUAS ZL42 TaxID=3231715 RepID=UPI00345E5C83
MPHPGSTAENGRLVHTPVARPGWLWWLGAGLIVVAAVVVALSRRRELVEAYQLIARVHLPGLAVAVVLEAMSFVCFAAVERWLLRAGDVQWSMWRMTAVAVAANAMAGALPGGAAFSAAWVFRQLSRRGVGQVHAAAVLVIAGALSTLSLVLLLAVGALAAGPAGPGALVRPVVGALVLTLTFGLVVLGLSRFASFRRVVRRAWLHTGERSRRVRQAEVALADLADHARRVQPGFLPWMRPFALALLNWMFDAACLAAAMWALGIGVPWHGLLLAYALTQVAGALRLTPGNLGIVEAGLSALLVAYGLQPGQAIAATFLYRIISYWALQPIGWACWIGVTLGGTRSPRSRRTRDGR